MRRAIALLGVGVAAIGLPATAVAPARGAAPAPKTFDAQLTFDPHYAEGEPSVAVNPTNPANIIVTFLADHYLGVPGVSFGQAPTARDVEEPIQGCDYVVTFDGGKTWARHTLPIANFDIDPTRPNCSDTIATFDPRGTAYVMGSSYNFPGFVVGLGDFRLISSRDGGLTWSPPSVISPTIFSPARS